jgi:hypothetical protein
MVLGVAFVLSCAVSPEGLRETPDGSGPMVTIDWDAEPLPEVPFPNDLATRPDPTSITGLRVNISEEAATESEREAREKLNELVGFGIFSMITVAFEEPLDLDEIARRHPNDFEVPEHDMDDAFFVVNVDPNSPGYLETVPLDVGHGRFPMDCAENDRYFPNDPRDWSPSLMFEVADEDFNGNGVLDWGEDTDNDGVLDIPNIYPPGGDPRDDLLTFYDRETDMLMVRPIVPMLEQTRYAVVLTERLVGVDGEPIRSPWEYVHHIRQTEALRPLDEFLPKRGLSMDDVAFAWTFTTGRITGDLVDIRRGFDGEGPWPFLADEYPGAIETATTVRNESDNDYTLPVDDLIGQLVELELFDEDAGDFLVRSYGDFADSIVGGTFTTPYLLADRDDGGHWDADEWWQLDPVAGTMHHKPQRIPFTCVLPKASPGFEPPWPVAIFGHGYGSSRFDFLGFAHAFNRVGMAACALDFPGHGPTIDEDQRVLANALLKTLGMQAFLYHLEDARFRDLNNDSEKDSGGDQWSADAFHTRDMVRQSAVDWMAMIRGFKACGTGEMELVESLETGPAPTGEFVTSCDWDGDGAPDLGGPDVNYYITGGSLGGINSAVAAGVMPEVTAWAPIVPGGGTLDIGVRTEIGGAVEALVGRLLTPMFLGMPQEDGTLKVVQMVNSVTDMHYLHVGTLPTVPAGGRIRVSNLDNGEVVDGWVPVDGTFRVGVAADAPDVFEKRVLAGMPLDGPDPLQAYTVPDNEGLGDRIVLEFFDASDTLVATLDTFEEEVEHEGVVMQAGSPLIAGSHGTGHVRASARLRKLALALASALEPGDAISYAPLYMDRPSEVLDAKPINIAIVPTPGDSIVSVNTGIALARAAGLVEWREVDERYGTTVDQWLIDNGVVQGLEQYGPHVDDAGVPVLFDADDLDDGTDGLGAPSDAPMRTNRTTTSGVSALRLPYVSTRGSHGFALPDQSLDFDINTFAIHQIAWYFASDGQEFLDDPCFEDASCEFLRPWSDE